MFRYALDHYADLITLRTQNAEHFVQAYGATCQPYFERLPAIFYFLRRLPYDSRLSVQHRHLSAAAALYVAEQQDYLQDASSHGGGLIDDVWMAFKALDILVQEADHDILSSHWRSNTLRFDELLELQKGYVMMDEHVPSKVKAILEDYLK